MANNTNQEPSVLNDVVSHSIPSVTTLEDTTNEQADHEEVLQHLRQALADADTFESTSLNYSVVGEEPQVCDTGQETQNGELNVTEVHTHSEESDMVTNADSMLHHTTEVIFSSRGQDTLLPNGSSEVLDIHANGSYSVDTITEGHVISIPSDMISDSAIITESEPDNTQNSIEIGEDSGVQLLQDGNHQQLGLVGQVESSDFEQQPTDISVLQPNSTTRHEVLQSDTFPQAHHAITLSAPSGMSMTPEVLQSVLEQVRAQHLSRQGQSVEAQPVHIKEEPTTMSTSISTSTPVSFTVVSPSQSTSTSNPPISAAETSVTHASAPPLGSSQNPIRIIQQGNRYTPMQQLSTEQLQQIMQVVQQQHVNKNTQDTGGAIIFNPQTNTRIMYRVIYPSELHKSQTSGGHTNYQVVRPATASQEQQTGGPHQKRPYRRRKDIASVPVSASVVAVGEQEEKDKTGAEGPELSKEEKEERKKHRPRTRSGRVSKPPKHMVQDYKHIHVLDWDEDYDDSDGGYSDFKHSDEEGKIKEEGAEDEQQPKSPDLFSGLGAVRPKNHKCQTCDKSYIGQAGLARHYRLNPDHCINPSEDGSVSSMHNGSIDGDENSKDTSLAQDNSLSRLSDSALDTTATPGGPNSGSTNLETFSEDSNTQDSLNSTGAPSPHTVLGGNSHRGRGRGRFRGRWAHLKYNAHMRRKNKLKEFIKQCSDEELMEVVLPRLVTSISLWEFLMMKSEKGGARPQVDVMYHEFESLTKHVRQACSSYLDPLTEEELQDDSLQCKMIKVSDKRLAVGLDLEPVTYRVREMPAGDCNTFSSLHNKLSAAAITRPQQETEPIQLNSYLDSDKSELRINGGLKRPLDSAVSDDDGLHNTAKRPRISTLPIPTAASAGLFTVKAHLSPQDTSVAGDNIQEILPSDPSDLLSCSSQISPNHAAIRVVAPSHVSITLPSLSPSSDSLISSSASTSSSLSSSLPLITKVITTSAGSSGQSSHLQISGPTIKQQTGNNANLLNSNSLVTSSMSVGHSTNPAKPQIVAVGAGGPHTGIAMSNSNTSTTTSILSPLIAGSGINVGTHRFVLAGPGSQTILTQHGAGPGTALLLAAGAAAGNHRVVVRHPTHGVATTHNQAKQGKVNHQASAPTAFRSLLTPSPSVNPAVVITKPTEVKVSRQLFHDATQSSSMSSLLGSSKAVSLLTNGKAPASSPNKAVPSARVSVVSKNVVSESSAMADNQMLANKGTLLSGKLATDLHERDNSGNSTSNKTLETPPSGQQFVTSPNKRGNSNSRVGMGVAVGVPPISDMDDMALELPPVEELGSALGQTPTDSFNGSFASTSPTVVTTMVAGTQFLNHSGSVSDSVLASHKPNGDVFVSSSKTASTSSANDPIHNSLSSPSLPNGNNNSVSSLFNSLKPAAIKANMNHAGVENAVAINNSSLFPSQSLKSENTPLVSGLPELNFSDHVEALSAETVPVQLSNGSVTSTVVNSELENVNVLTQEIPVSNHLSDGTMEEEMEQEVTSNNGNTEVLASTDDCQQLLLSEGTNIYQTEDGIFIQSSNGNTYQLQGAQGLTLEAVQTLLSGALDQWAS